MLLVVPLVNVNHIILKDVFDLLYYFIIIYTSKYLITSYLTLIIAYLKVR